MKGSRYLHILSAFPETKTLLGLLKATRKIVAFGRRWFFLVSDADVPIAEAKRSGAPGFHRGEIIECTVSK